MMKVLRYSSEIHHCDQLGSSMQCFIAHKVANFNCINCHWAYDGEKKWYCPYNYACSVQLMNMDVHVYKHSSCNGDV